MTAPTFRHAELDDLPVLTTIYNQAIEANQTADTIPLTPEQRNGWFKAHQDKKYPLYVVITNNQIVGYGTLSKYRNGRKALEGVVEVSYYLDSKMQGKGIGTALLRFLLKTAQELGFRHAYALLLDSNTASTYLLEKFGFVRWGHLPNIARMRNGLTCGQFIYGKALTDW